MAYILSLLPLLACPIGMGLMMRGKDGPAPGISQAGNERHNGIAGRGTSWRAGLCLRWKVVVGLALVGVGTSLVAPRLSGVVAPLLIVLACPISMALAMLGAGSNQRAADGEQPDARRLARLRREHASIGREIAAMEAVSNQEAQGAASRHGACGEVTLDART